MKEQEYIIKNIKSCEPKHIFECGQCFRWELEEDGSYTGIVGENVLNVKKEQNNITIKGICKDNIKDVCENYLNLKVNYEDIKKELSKVDNNLKLSIKYGEGIRILKQDVWETLISFIISANNNIPRIKGIINKMSKKYGKEIIWNNKKYYTFPTPQELSIATVKDLKELGLGFRDVRVFETTQMVINNQIDINKLEKIEDIIEIREELLKCPGVGPKVADCIMLFAMNRYESFPIDVWVKRVMTELYFKPVETEARKEFNNKEILNIANEKFGKYAGLAQQYLFYWRREN